MYELCRDIAEIDVAAGRAVKGQREPTCQRRKGLVTWLLCNAPKADGTLDERLLEVHEIAKAALNLLAQGARSAKIGT